jgi:ureidoglycolate lyase
VPLAGGDILHVVAPTEVDGRRAPDLNRLRCFRVPAGRGLCMRPGCWHATFVIGGQVICLMLTRQSTTRELVAHLNRGAQAEETSIVRLDAPRIRIRRDGVIDADT